MEDFLEKHAPFLNTLCKWGWIFYGVSIPLVSYRQNGLRYISWVLLAVLCLSSFLTNFKNLKTRIPYFVFVLAVNTSLALSFFTNTLGYSWTVLLASFSSFALALSDSRNSANHFFCGLAISAFAFLLLCLLQAVFFKSSRLNGLGCGDVNCLGTIFALSGFFCWCKTFRPQRKKIYSAALWSAFIASITCVVLTASRQALFLLVVGLFLPFIKPSRYEHKDWLFHLLLVLTLGILLTLSILFLPALSFLKTKIQDTFSTLLGLSKTDQSLVHRLEMAEAALQGFLERPFFGHGFNAFSINHIYKEFSAYPWSHCDPAEILYCFGACGFLLMRIPLYCWIISPFLSFFKIKDDWPLFVVGLLFLWLIGGFAAVHYHEKINWVLLSTAFSMFADFKKRNIYII